jgi:hypothetical protein
MFGDVVEPSLPPPPPPPLLLLPPGMVSAAMCWFAYCSAESGDGGSIFRRLVNIHPVYV